LAYFHYLTVARKTLFSEKILGFLDCFHDFSANGSPLGYSETE